MVAAQLMGNPLGRTAGSAVSNADQVGVAAYASWLGSFSRAADASSGSRMPRRSAVSGSRQGSKLASNPSATAAVRPNPRLQLTPLRGREIGAFLKIDFGLTVIPI